MDVLFYQFQLSGKSGLAFTKDNIEFPVLCILDHTVEFRPVPVSAGIVIIAIDSENLPVAVNCVFNQHTFLILDGCAVILGRHFITILI